MEQKQEHTTKTALLVEDDALQQKVICCYLEKLNYQVDAADDATTAINKLSEKAYFLIVTDLGLPDQSGETVITATRTNSLNQLTPIIVCTAHASREKEQQCLELGANKVLIKPIVKLEILEQAISECFK